MDRLPLKRQASRADAPRCCEATTVEDAMLKGIIMGAAALAIATLPAAAQTQTQTQTPRDMPQTTAPSSGTGVPAKPGPQGGPSVKQPSETSGAAADQSSDHMRQQDSSKIPGAPGGKSGAPARKPGQMEK
jgi:hypothetical protein